MMRFLFLELSETTLADWNLGTDGTFSWYCVEMARLAHIAVVNVAHHATQRGNARQSILTDDDEYVVYLNLLHKYAELYELSES
jgi:hypothetical protein